MKLKTLSILALLATSPSFAHAENWPMWRGPRGDGTSQEKGLPEKWSTTENVVWKTALPDRGNSSPVVFGEYLFLTQAVEKTGKRMLQCFERKTGTLLWEQGTIFKEPELTHGTNPYCSASPATDGTRIVVFFASAGLYCYDTKGQEVWKRTDLGEQRHIWGNGTSPVLSGDRVYLNFGPGKKTTLYAFDLSTGRTLWSHEEPGGDSGEGGNKKWIGSWADPLIRTTSGQEEVILSYPGRVVAFSPASGQELWSCAGLNQLVYNSPVITNEGLVVAFGGYQGMGLAVQAGGRGDLTTQRLWHLPKVSQRIGSGVVHEGHHYILSDGGMAECRELKTGKLLYAERLKGPKGNGQNWSSLVLTADGKCYAANQGGDCFIFRASPTFELIGMNSLGEKIIGSIAVSEGQLFIRGYQHLWCIGKKE